MIAPVVYQGGKNRLASLICSQMKVTPPFYDLCCGSGAISIEMVRRGLDPHLVTMVDLSPWGAVWEAIGSGTFDLSRFKHYLDQVPSDPWQIKEFMKDLGKSEVADIPYVFLVLQAGSFGGTPVTIKNGKWSYEGFRDHWTNGKVEIHPMKPPPSELFERVNVLVERMQGITGIWGDVLDVDVVEGTAYIDPPYVGTTGYRSGKLDLQVLLKKIHVPTYISEAAPFSDNALILTRPRKTGRIRGDRQNTNEEWLSALNGAEFAMKPLF